MSGAAPPGQYGQMTWRCHHQTSRQQSLCLGPRGQLSYELVDGALPELTTGPPHHSCPETAGGRGVQGHHGPIPRPGSLSLPSSALSVAAQAYHGW